MSNDTTPARYGTNAQGAFVNQADGAYVSHLDYLALAKALEKAREEGHEMAKFKEVMSAATESLNKGEPLNLESLFKGELASAMFATMFAGEFTRAGATNYLELMYKIDDFGDFTVTIQKADGKTPGQRIEELEESHVQVIQSRDHYKRMTEEGLKQLRDSRITSVKLPTGYVARPGHPINEGERSVMIPKDGGAWLSRFDVEHMLRLAGIQVTEGEKE